MKAYAGIGSRETPPDVLELMQAVAVRLAYKGWTLRSGGAEGADTAFEQGAVDAWTQRGETSIPTPEIYLPWPGFNADGRVVVHDPGTGPDGFGPFDFVRPHKAAYPIAQTFHPAWGKLTRGGHSLHARNVHQLMGYDVDPPAPSQFSKFVLCWTKGGSGGGGTGQVIRMANSNGIPVYDLFNNGVRKRVERQLLYVGA